MPKAIGKQPPLKLKSVSLRSKSPKLRVVEQLEYLSTLLPLDSDLRVRRDKNGDSCIKATIALAESRDRRQPFGPSRHLMMAVSIWRCLFGFLK